MKAGELDDTATAFLVADNTRVDGCLADEGVGAIDILGRGAAELIFCWTTDDEAAIVDVLSSHSVRSGDMD